jgi:malic enzyme
LNEGRLYPDLERIREVSVIVARQVIRQAQEQGLDRETSIRHMDDEELDAWIRRQMYDPRKKPTELVDVAYPAEFSGPLFNSSKKPSHL